MTDRSTTIEDAYERSGYEAGYSGKQPHQADRWAEAYDLGNNVLAYVLAGWVAGRAMRIVEALHV
jgi:hypothetical protein